MTPSSVLILCLGTLVYFFSLLMVFGYFGMPTKYYYVIIGNYVAFTLYYYYKYSYYNLNTYSYTSVKNVPGNFPVPDVPSIVRPSNGNDK